MKKDNDSVPRLDLAPQLKRPLSIWNPLDYLRLLYWVFFFPQALPWYVEKYGGGEGLAEQKTEESLREFLRQHPNQWRLLFQGLILMVCVPFLFCILLQQIGFTIDGVVFGVVLGVLTFFCVGGDLRPGVSFRVAGGVAFGMSGVVVCVAFGVAGGVAFGVAFGVVIGVMASSAVGGVVLGVVYINIFKMIVFLLLEVVFLGVLTWVGGVFLNIVTGTIVVLLSEVVFLGVLGWAWVVFSNIVTGEIMAGEVAGEVAWVVAGGVAGGVAILRPENWLIGATLNSNSIHNRSFLLPRITPIPLPLLTNRLKFWLRKDWQLGLENIDQLLKYSLQSIPVVNAINEVLAEIPAEQIIYRISQLAENPYDWELVKFASASFDWKLVKCFLQGAGQPTRLDTPSRTIAAGFWHLHEKKPKEATVAFKKVRSFLYGEEMFLLAYTLTQFQTATFPDTIAKIRIPNFPPEPHLRPVTWKVIKDLHRVVEDTQLIVKATSKSARAFALARAIGQLIKILDNANILPQAEKDLIVDIAQNWKKTLGYIAQDVGDISITKPVKNPYVIGDPVEGDLFVGREDIMRQLKEKWVMSSQPQSVMLYGHRRMGKTSILRNIAKSSGADVQIIYVDLQSLEAISQGMGEVFLAISDAISESISLPPPDTKEFLRLPERTFKLYLKQVIKKLDNKSLIIAMDEFETLENLINAQQLPGNFMAVLGGFVQMSSKIAFAFAWLQTLEEKTQDDFKQFLESLTPIRVSFLNRATTHQLLANPDPDFLLDYESEAMDRIYDLTFGQAYLVQLLGFLLVRCYNKQVFKEGKPKKHIFTVADVNAIIEQNELFETGGNYFTGVWGQAGENAPGQQDILRTLANHSGNCSRAMVQELTGLDQTIINDALEILFRHDVIVETEDNLTFAVELFHRWVVKYQLEE